MCAAGVQSQLAPEVQNAISEVAGKAANEVRPPGTSSCSYFACGTRVQQLLGSAARFHNSRDSDATASALLAYQGLNGTSPVDQT